MKINQFVPVLDYGDAVSNDTIAMQKALKELGFESKIYIEHISNGVTGDFDNILDYKGDKDSILIIHHSLYTGISEFLLNLPDKKILRYHNITPAKYLKDHGDFVSTIRNGINQARNFAQNSQIAFCDSRYNEIEIRKMGQKRTRELPIIIDFSKYDNNETANEVIKDLSKNDFNIICVGRIVENKNQLEVVKAFNSFIQDYSGKAKLFIIGNDTLRPHYVLEIKEYINRNELQNKVKITSKISDIELVTYYRNSQASVVYSDHEGFCVPLVESMYCNLPAIGKNSSAIPYTLGESGILVNNIEELSNSFLNLAKDKSYRDEIIKKQNKRLTFFEYSRIKSLLNEHLQEILNKKWKPTVQIKGPFESSYSLAMVNRELAEHIDKKKKYDVSIYCSEGPGDYLPDKEAVNQLKIEYKYLWEKSIPKQAPDLEIRTMWPIRANDMTGKYKAWYFAWEESKVPKSIVDDFNKYLDCVYTMSEFVTNALKDSGIKIPVITVGSGVQTEVESKEIKAHDNITFLNISSGFPRKGLDILVKAYTEAFKSKEDVTLIIKTFKNEHNNIEEIIKKYTNENSPTINLILEDLPQSEIENLYKKTDVYVSSARGEGFNRPVAEAMVRGIPVIVTDWGGHTDFCNTKNSLLIDYQLEPSQTHLNTEGSMWAEPNIESLKNNLLQVYEEIRSNSPKLVERIKRAKKEASIQCSWDNVSEKVMKSYEKLKKENTLKIGMVSSWNCKCGIANYSKDIIENNTEKNIEYIIFARHDKKLLYKDKQNVIRCWYDRSQQKDPLDDLYNEISVNNVDIIHFQFNFGFYHLDSLSRIIQRLHNDNVKVIVTFHSTKDVDLGEHVSLNMLEEAGKYIDLAYCFKEDDISRLDSIIDNWRIKLSNLPINTYTKLEESNINEVKDKLGLKNNFLISTHGFMLPHKGIDLIIEAMGILKKKGFTNIKFLSLTPFHVEHNTSKVTSRDCKELADKYKLQDDYIHISNFIDPIDIYKILGMTNLIIFPYKHTQESASASIRNALATNVPILTSGEHIFDDIKTFTRRIENLTAEELAEEIILYMEHPDRDKNLLKERKKFVEKNNSISISSEQHKSIREMYIEGY